MTLLYLRKYSFIELTRIKNYYILATLYSESINIHIRNKIMVQLQEFRVISLIYKRNYFSYTYFIVIIMKNELHL